MKYRDGHTPVIGDIVQIHVHLQPDDPDNGGKVIGIDYDDQIIIIKSVDSFTGHIDFKPYSASVLSLIG